MNSKKKTNELSMAAMVLGIMGLVLSCVYFGIVPCFAGLILSIIALATKARGKGMAIAGLVTSIIGFFVFMFVLVVSVNNNNGEVKDSGYSDETKTETKEEFITSCQEYQYKVLARNPDDYIGSRIVVDVKITQILQGGLFDSGEYYRVYTNDEYDFWSGDEFFMNDCRVDDDVKLLEDDIIRVYGEFDGMQSVKRALTGTKELVPAINAYYIELLEE